MAGSTGTTGLARSIPGAVIKTFERAYPFGWLGIMSETPPVGEVIYARHERGFAVASLRGPALSCIIQCGLDRASPTGRTTGSGRSSNAGFRRILRKGS